MGDRNLNSGPSDCLALYQLNCLPGPSVSALVDDDDSSSIVVFVSASCGYCRTRHTSHTLLGSVCLQSGIIAANIEFQTRLMCSSPTSHLANSLQLPKALKEPRAQCGIYLWAASEAPEAVGWVLGKHRLH